MKHPKRLAEVIHPVPGSSRLYELEEPFPIEYENKGERWRFWLTPPWRYDLASIPRIFWPIISPRELGFEPPAGHDEGIYKRGVLYFERWNEEFESWQNYGWVPLTRKELDKIFAILMRQHGVPKLRRRAAYLAVRSWARMKKLFTGSEW